MRLLTINTGIFEFPRRDFVLEEQIDLSERPVLGLWKSEPAPDVAQEVGTCVEEGSFCPPIPSSKEVSHIYIRELMRVCLPIGDSILGVTEL